MYYKPEKVVGLFVSDLSLFASRARNGEAPRKIDRDHRIRSPALLRSFNFSKCDCMARCTSGRNQYTFLQSFSSGKRGRFGCRFLFLRIIGELSVFELFLVRPDIHI